MASQEIFENIKTSLPNRNDLSRFETNTSISIPMEVFEKMYLSPQLPVKGDLRKTFGNPTPYALLGFLLTTTPFACCAMGWRGAGGGGAALIGVFYFFGGMLQIIGSLLELFLGNTFPCVVFGTYGAFWLALGATIQPVYNAMGAYTADATNAAEKAAGMEGFYASFAFFLCFLGLLSFMYLICAFRINCVFVFIFFFLVIGVELLAASYWALAEGKMEKGVKLEEAGGACVFVFSLAGWYLLFSMLLQSVDFPLSLPVGDLSTRFKGLSAKNKAHADSAV